MALRSPSEEFDIIFIGGGTSACVTAGRLAQADPNLKILILETGPLTQDKLEHIQPARCFGNLKGLRETFTLHQSKPSAAVSGRSLMMLTGRCLGGGSSVNFVMYTRAAGSDYDDWDTVHGNNGWGSKYMIPLLKKAETFQPKGDFPTHGRSGPIQVSFAPETNVASKFLEVASEYDKERKFAEDLNGFYSCNVYGKWPRYIDGTTGQRSDVPHHYIYNHTEHTKLKILERRRATRVIFENLRAVGVEHVSDLVRHSEDIHEAATSYASKLVVVSAGAFGSPAILERSGIGGTGILRRNGIPQIVNLPGVGEHYMDHPKNWVPYFASEDADTMDAIFHGSEAEIKPFAKRWAEDGQGLMAQNGFDAGIKLRPNADDLKEIGPHFETRWKNYFEKAPDKPVMWFGPFATYAGNDSFAPHRKYFSLGYYIEYPVSTGRVHISAGLNPYGKLDFEAGFLDDPVDLGILRWGYKKSREFARRMQVYRGEVVPDHPDFPEGSEASAHASAQPVEISSPDIKYSAEDDRVIDEYHRKMVDTSWHSIGTCAMKPREKSGVVDSRLNVYGVQNLKVADCSIAPSNVSANTYNTALAIGEKAAVIIAQDLGIKGISEV